MANTRPNWRALYRPNQAKWAKAHPPVQTEEFKAKRKLQLGLAKKCGATCRSNGLPCRRVALQGSDRCRFHGGMTKALIAAEEKRGQPVFQVSDRKARNRALIKLATTTPWPEGLPHRPDLDELDVVRRGELFEAWFNRELAPDVFRHALRLRKKIIRRPRP